jgi:hypothetical protein
MVTDMNHYITHIFNDKIPASGLKKIAFITVTDDPDDQAEYFIGTDNNPISEDEIKEWERKKRIFMVSGKPIRLADDDTLYVNSAGKLLLANYIEPDKNLQVLDLIIKSFTDQAVNITYSKAIKFDRLPTTQKFANISFAKKTTSKNARSKTTK